VIFIFFCGTHLSDSSCPKPTTRRRLYILSHECGHVVLKHNGSLPSHRQEYEAEQFAHQQLRLHEVAVPRKATIQAKEYVAYRIDQAIRLGRAKRLDREAVAWTSQYHSQVVRDALRFATVELLDLGRKKRR